MRIEGPARPCPLCLEALSHHTLFTGAHLPALRMVIGERTPDKISIPIACIAVVLHVRHLWIWPGVCRLVVLRVRQLCKKLQVCDAVRVWGCLRVA